MQNLKYKVGDVVYVKAIIERADMNDTLYPYCISVGNDAAVFWTEVGDLLTSEHQTSKADHVYQGDVVRLNNGSFHHVLSLADGYLLTTSPLPVPKNEVHAIYRKVWEKPKELEEMSKEELIALVKELKGE